MKFQYEWKSFYELRDELTKLPLKQNSPAKVAGSAFEIGKTLSDFPKWLE